MLKRIFYIVCLWEALSFSVVQAQSMPDSTHLVRIRTILNKVANEEPQYKETLDISVNNISVGDFLKNIAKASELNMNVESDGEKKISCNFKQITILEAIFYICKEYNYDLELTGRILSVYPCKSPYTEPLITLSYEPVHKRFSFDFTQAKLIDVARKFSETSDINIIIPNPLLEERITAFGKGMTIDDALQSIATTNQLIAQRKDDTMWALFRQNDKESNDAKPIHFHMDNLEVDSLGFITARMSDVNIHNIVQDLCQKLNLSYFFIDNLEHSTGIYVEKVNFDSFLKTIFTGTNFTWRVDNGIYMFGKENQGITLSTARVIPMKFRSVNKVLEIIPKDLSQTMEILPFPDLNSLVINGDQRKVMQLVEYLNEIDKSVPLISIDVIILDATDTNAQEAGISMGLGKEPATTSGSLSPGVNMTLGAASVNKLINSFNGFGSINLGCVTPNFYLGLKLLEENGKITLRSTPRLSTLNGHKASLKSGEMKYYKESQTYLTGTQNPIQSESYQWKNVEANLSLDITPYVSLDSCITMQIDLTQSEFTEREEKDAPPGKTTRSFNSIIKVRNEEMVLLGGIERNLSSRTSSGLPFIARIPILRWIFGSSSKKRSVQKLNVFIKPTVIK